MSGRASPLVVEADYPQSRVGVYPLSVLAQCLYPGKDALARGFDPELSSGVWQEPVSGTVLLRPAFLTPEWATTFTGIYARLQSSALSFTTPGKWRQVATGGTGDYWHYGAGLTADEVVATTASYAADQPFLVGWFSFSPSGSVGDADFECGWGGTGTKASGVALEVFRGGLVRVYKDGKAVGEGQASGAEGGDAKQQSYQHLLLVPTRRRELLVVGSGGNGFSHVFADLDESATEVCPGGPFWVRARSSPGGPRAAQLQLAPLQFVSPGAAVSELLAFPEDVQDGQAGPNLTVFHDLYGGTVGSALTAPDGSSPFVAGETGRVCRIRVSLTGGARSPAVYGAYCEFSGVRADTADAPTDLSDKVTEAVLTVGETADSVSLGLALERTGGLEGFRTGLNRPVRARFAGGGLVIGGVSQPPSSESTPYEDADRVAFDVRDRWARLEQYRFQDLVPLDGLTFTAALKALVGTVLADPARFDIEESGFTVPLNASCTRGEWSALVEPGDTAADWVRRLFDNYAADWFYGFVPTAAGTVFRARSPEGLGTAPVLTLRPTVEEAAAEASAAGFSGEDAFFVAGQFLYRTFRETVLPPEATDVRVTGYDPRTGKVVQSYKVDEDAEDPGLGPDERPANWVGAKLRYGWTDPAVTSQALCDRCCLALFRRLSRPRRLAEWSSDLLFRPDGDLVWRGDNVELAGKGVYRVTSLRCELAKEPDWSSADGLARWGHRPAVYTGERIDEEADAWRGSSPAADFDRIVAWSLANLPVERGARDSRGLFRQTPSAREAP